MSEPARSRETEDFAPGIERAFAEVPLERTEVVRVDGEVPAFVRGTYYLNGPARFSRGGLRYRHWLDGDGMVCALRFSEERIELTARFVRSAKWTAEEEAGRPIYRTFGTSFPGDQLVRGIALEPPANVSVYPFGDSLLAFGEQGLPLELDPETLETRGLFNFGGGLNPLSPFAAHPKIDPVTGELFNFGVSFSATAPVINLYHFSAGGALLGRRRIPLEFPCSLHDFAVGPRHAVFYVAPYGLDMAALQAGRTLMEALSWEPERGSRLLVADRETGELVATIPAGNRYSLHAINAFEDGGSLVVDVVELDRPVYDQYEVVPDLFTDVSPGRPVRLVLDLQAGRVVERREMAYDRAPDFPAVDPRLAHQPCDELWILGISATGRPGRKFFDQLAHLDWRRPEAADVYTSPPGRYLGGEPAFVPGGEHGAVICQEFDAVRGESAFLVFDAADVVRGPLARLRLASPVHLGFHAFFAPA
ncbi:MAG TPA: carotenoid oxygenase family protein [Thermoanaerobaculia bacterium]|nr:carotenoid oxygenase family protein [Thermoanaerobaculia bacterium]